IVMREGYGGERHALEIVTGTAIWYHSGLPPVPIRWLLVRDPSGVRDPQAFLCTNLNATPTQILGWFVQRWSIETTFQEVRDHLGAETQRQWSDLAILRTTPALLGLYSLTTTWANTLAGASGFTHPNDLQRRYRSGPPRFMVSTEFFNISEKERHGGNSSRTPTTTHRYALLRCIKMCKVEMRSEPYLPA